MPKVNILNETDIRSLVINELRKRDKILSKLQLEEIIKKEVVKQNKPIYTQLDKLRRKLNRLNEN